MMRIQSTANRESNVLQSYSDQLGIVILLRHVVLVVFFADILTVCSQLSAQNHDNSLEKLRVAFSETPRPVRTPGPLVQEVEAPMMGVWPPPPELIRPQANTSHAIENHLTPQTSRSTIPSYQTQSAPPARTSTPGYSPITYIPGIKPIGEVDISIAPKAKESDMTVPPKVVRLDNAAQQLIYDSTNAVTYDDFWLQSGREMVAYQPLYFEEVNLERYGRSHPGQAFLSIGRFFGTIPTMPYQMSVYDPRKPLFWNWKYRAGWGAPRVRELPPFQWNALSIQAISLTGAAALIP